jgi:hypothetical protein
VTRHWWAHARQPLGWTCRRTHPASTPCLLVPRWWNLWGMYWGRVK